MKLAYFSPLGPQRSGIADYSEELLPHLAEAGAEVTLFVEGFRPANAAVAGRFDVRNYRREPAALASLGEFDAAVYHMGNDHRYHAGVFDAMRGHAGIVVFHDFALQDFFLGLARARGDMRLYLDEVGACHGEPARREAADALDRGATPAMFARPLDFPLNSRLARSAEAIIVHSDWSRARFESIAPGVPVRRVNHHITASAAAGIGRAGSSLSVNDNGAAPSGDEAVQSEQSPDKRGPVRIASFGLITPDKGIERALRALSALRERHDFRYTLVGDPNSYFDVRALVREYKLEDRVEITGHVSLEEFERLMSETDIALNLRERTVGETSGSLCRIMAAGVASVVSAVGWFGELPDDAVVKVEPGGHSDELLRAYLERLMEDAPLRARLGANARRHVLAEHDIRRSAAGYLDFIREVVAVRPRRRLLDGLTSELSLLGVEPGRDESLMFGVAAEFAALVPLSLFAPSNGTHAPDEKHNVERPNSNGHAARAKAAAAVTTTPGAETSSAKVGADSGTNSSAATNNGVAFNNGAATNGGATWNGEGRGRKLEGVDYKRAAVEYPRRITSERLHHLRTKPFYNLANKPERYAGDGIDADTFRHFCDFANVAQALALPPDRRILDVGCGSGWLSEYFARLGYDVTGIDISPDLVEVARERVARVPYGADDETPLRCRFLIHDAEGEPLPETFDAVVCYDSLHHFEDERAVMRSLSQMTAYGGALFILEGDRPEAGSENERELLEVMRTFGTLESPFGREYLRELLDEFGFAVVGDYVSVNGLFDRDSLEGGRMRVEPPGVNYLLCKKVTAVAGRPASAVPDSRNPSAPAARMSFPDGWLDEVEGGATTTRVLLIENAGDTLWLKGSAERAGSCMLGVRLYDEVGTLVAERHGTPPLPRALAPGEAASVRFELKAPHVPGLYTLKLDVVAQHVCWFEQRGSAPLKLQFRVL
jgi:glycosyltransferase involved in cell wall biosynthesis/2-polyprenyl-3-methyl-5-hydroxy-6-metoxy-1,4-benzoquinol methylase